MKLIGILLVFMFYPIGMWLFIVYSNEKQSSMSKVDMYEFFGFWKFVLLGVCGFGCVLGGLLVYFG